MDIRLVRSSDVTAEELNAVIRVFSSADGTLKCIALPGEAELPDGTLEWSILFRAIQAIRAQHRIPLDVFVVLLTSRPNALNWFSVFDGPNRQAFVHTGDWAYYVSCAPAFAIAFEVIENCLQCITFPRPEDADLLAHTPPIGCINDMCAWKPDISLKLRTADICSDCMARIVSGGVSQSLIEQLLATMERIREQALFTAGRRDAAPANRQPFPVAFTKRKLQMTSEPLRKFLLLIDHFDSLVRTATLMVGRIVLREAFHDFAVRQELVVRPSLGHWVAALQALSNTPIHGEDVHLPLPANFRERMAMLVERATDERIVQLRNEKRSHGYCDCHEESYAAVFESCLPAVRDIERILAPILESFTLVHVVRDDRIEGRRCRATVLRLMGDHPDFIQETIEYAELPGRPIAGHVYAVTRQDVKWYDLHDSVVFNFCTLCQHSRVLLSDGEKYLDPYAGHRVALDAGA